MEALYEPPRLLPPGAGQGTARRPNVIVLILESTRADALGLWPTQGPGEMPFLRDLAARSVRMRDVQVIVPHTSKALVALFCGMYPRLELQITEATPGGLPLRCLPSLLGEAGFATMFMQTAAGGFEDRPGLLRNLGFAEWRLQEELAAPAFERSGYFGMDERAMLEPALAWIRAQREREVPWLLTLLTVTAHDPYALPGDGLRPPGPQRQSYARALAHVDDFARDLFGALQAAGVLEDSVLVVLGDHGEAFGEHHGRRQHDAVPYQEVMAAPLFFHGPEQWLGPPRTVGGLRSHLDLMPTLLELAGLPWEGRLAGRSALSTAGHDAVVSSCHYENTCLAVRQGDRKVVFHYDRLPTEVFDLAADPGEQRDLAQTLPAAEVDDAVVKMLGRRVSVRAFYRRD